MKKIMELIVGVYNGEHYVFPFLSKLAKGLFVVSLVLLPILSIIEFVSLKGSFSISLILKDLLAHWYTFLIVFFIFLSSLFFDALATMDEKLTTMSSK